MCSSLRPLARHTRRAAINRAHRCHMHPGHHHHQHNHRFSSLRGRAPVVIAFDVGKSNEDRAVEAAWVHVSPCYVAVSCARKDVNVVPNAPNAVSSSVNNGRLLFILIPKSL